MHDGAGGLGHYVDDFRHGWSVLVTGDDDGARHDQRRVWGLVEEGSQQPLLVLVVQVGRDVDADCHGHLLGRGGLRW